MCAFTIACVIEAYKRGKKALAYLLVGVLFGLLLENCEVLTSSYTYGRFRLMVGHAPLDVPLFVGFAWGLIMYTARLFSNAAGLPTFAAAALDTLLALSIDLSMDAVAYRMHFWNWDWSASGRNPLTAECLLPANRELHVEDECLPMPNATSLLTEAANPGARTSMR